MGEYKRPGRLRFMLIRLWSFTKRLISNKKSTFGLSVIVFFLFLSFGAPLLTPYNTIGEDPDEPLFPLGAPSKPPTWMKSFPVWLGGNPDLSENLRVVQDPGLPRLKEDGGDFLLQTDSPSFITYHTNESVEFPMDPPPGFSKYNKEGSFEITYRREAGVSNNKSVVTLSTEFDWPYNGAAGRFMGSLSLLVLNKSKTDESGRLNAQVQVDVYLGKTDGKKWRLWPTPTLLGVCNMPLGFVEDPSRQVRDPKMPSLVMARFPWKIVKPRSGQTTIDGWIISRDSYASKGGHIDSESNNLVNEYTEFGSESFPHRMIFNGSGKYVLSLTLTFLDEGAPEEVETSVFVDDFGLLIYGTSFGILGSDHYGRDLFSQLIYGTRISLYLGLTVSIMGVVIGVSVGLASGYLGRFVDELLMRVTDILLVLPGLPLLIVLIAVLGAKLENLILLLGLLGWMGFARLVRSQVLSLRERPFVEAAKAVGAGRFHIIINHILPSVMSLVYVSLATSVPGAVTAEASLSWLGFYDPYRMSWGRMLHDVFEADATSAWWWILPPGILISLLAASFILLGYALDEVLNPKLRERR